MNSLNDTIRNSNNNNNNNINNINMNSSMNSNFINDGFKNLNISSNSIGNSGQFQQQQQQQLGYTIDNVVSRGNDFKYTFSLPSKEQILNLKQGDLVKLIFTENNQAERMFVEIIDLCIYETNGVGEIFHHPRRNSGGSDDGNGDSSSSNSIHKDEKNKLVNSQSNSFNNNISSRSNIANSSGSSSGSGGNSGNDFGLNIKTIKFQGILDNNPYQLRSLKLGDRVEFFDYNILSIYNQPNQMFHPDLDSVPGSIKQLFDQLCLVSNRILVDKDHIGYIFREKGTFPNDSGWRIFQGDEPDDYMNKKENYQIVTLASVLNVDDSILLLLGSSIDRHFEYDFESRQWKELVEK